tara:strand:- start:342 stop:503 length:162 start_codon:yes stop_codon:yes gene_type:complete
MPDALKMFLGSAGTLWTIVLEQAESSAAIFAGCATGIFMLISAAVKIQELKRK